MPCPGNTDRWVTRSGRLLEPHEGKPLLGCLARLRVEAEDGAGSAGEAGRVATGETRVGRQRPKQEGRAPGRPGHPSRRCGLVRRLEGVATASAGVVYREWSDLCLHRGSPSTAVRPAARRHVDPGRAWTVGVDPIGRSAGALTQAESRRSSPSRRSGSTRCAAGSQPRPQPQPARTLSMLLPAVDHADRHAIELSDAAAPLRSTSWPAKLPRRRRPPAVGPRRGLPGPDRPARAWSARPTAPGS